MSNRHSPVRAARAGAPLALLLLLLITLALATSVAGCGGSSDQSTASKSPAKILAASRAAADAATSVHIVSTASLGRLSLTNDLELASDGGRAKLSFIGLDYEVIRIGDTLYLKGNAALFRRLFHGGGPHVPAGTWLEGSASTGRLARFAGLTDLSSRLALLLKGTDTLTKGATTTIDGQPAIELKEAAKLYAGTLAVATTGKPYPLQIVKRGRESGKTTFSGWNQPISLSAPANAIELSKLERSGR